VKDGALGSGTGEPPNVFDLGRARAKRADADDCLLESAAGWHSRPSRVTAVAPLQ
jgi:hypothetical protein